MNFASEGLIFIVAATVIAFGTFALALNRRSWPLWLLGVGLVGVAIGIAFLFRDPERFGQRSERLVIAPADGRVVLVSEVDEPSFMQGRAKRISIFMNVFNVHVNRYPVSGTVRYVRHVRANAAGAAGAQSSPDDQQRSVGIESGRHRVLVRQIAGLTARRILTYVGEGTRVRQGDRMGLIRSGSRVDVFVPVESALRVRVGEATIAGATPIAELAAP